MRTRLPSYVPMMAIVTALYLTLEIPFSVRLVEVLGGSPTADDISVMERSGRVLTGLAVAIWVAGTMVFPRMDRNGWPLSMSTPAALVAAVISALVTYHALDFIGHSAGDAPAETRKEAYLAALARGSLALPPDADHRILATSATIQAFVPAQALLGATGMSIADLSASEARARIGTPDSLRVALSDAVDSSYGRYREASQAYLEARSKIPSEAEAEYAKLIREVVAKHGSVPGPGFTTAWYVGQLRRKGMKIPSNFTLHHKGTFVSEYVRLARTAADTRYERTVSVHSANGRSIPAGLSRADFSVHPGVQPRIRRAVGLPEHGRAVHPDMGRAEFEQHAWRPLAEAAQSRILGAALAPDSEFAPGGKHAASGREAAQAARIPSMAIVLSVAGALLHVFKFSGYAFQMAGHATRMTWLSGFLRHAAAAAVTAAAVIWASSSGHPGAGTHPAANGYEPPFLLKAAISVQPGMAAAGDILGRIGGWQAYAAKLPTRTVPVTSVVAAHPSSPGGYVDLPSTGPMPSWRPSGAVTGS